MKVKNIGECKVGDIVRLPRDRCGCCINPRSIETVGEPGTWSREFRATILAVDKKNNLVHVGFTDNDPCPAGISAIPLADQTFGIRYGLHIKQNTVCELLAAAKSSSMSSHSFGFLFACIGVGAGVSHYTCMQRNNPKAIEKSLTR